MRVRFPLEFRTRVAADKGDQMRDRWYMRWMSSEGRRTASETATARGSEHSVPASLHPAFWLSDGSLLVASGWRGTP
jgi:hypothetical protein